MLLDNPFVSDARVEKEAIVLLNHGAQVEVWCELSRDLPLAEVRNGIKISRKIDPILYAPLRRGFKKALAMVVDELVSEDIDVLHCHDFQMLTIGSKVKQRNNSIKLIYDAHEYLKGWPFYKTSTGLNKWKGKLVYHRLLQLERKEMSAADVVITITDTIADRFVTWARLKEKPIVLGNFPLAIEVKPNPNYFRKLFNFREDKKIIIHSGSIYQNDHQLFELFNFLYHDARFVLIFLGNRPRFEQVKSYVSNNEQWQKVIFFHPYPTSQQETIQLISHGDIGLLFVNKEWEAHNIGFSNRFVEYIMAGIPVIATPQEFTVQFNLKFEVACFYSSNKFEEFINAINNLNRQYDRFKENTNLTRNQISWEIESNKLINLYSLL